MRSLILYPSHSFKRHQREYDDRLSAERVSLTSYLATTRHLLHDGLEGVLRLLTALASDGKVGQILLQRPANHLVHDLGEVPVAGGGVQPERPVHGGIEVDGGTTSGGHAHRIAADVKTSKR